jgi:hypothetical protein
MFVPTVHHVVSATALCGLCWTMAACDEGHGKCLEEDSGGHELRCGEQLMESALYSPELCLFGAVTLSCNVDPDETPVFYVPYASTVERQDNCYIDGSIVTGHHQGECVSDSKYLYMLHWVITHRKFSVEHDHCKRSMECFCTMCKPGVKHAMQFRIGNSR